MLHSCRKHPCHCSTVLHPVLCIQPGLGCQATLCCAHGVICVHLQHDLGIVRAELRAVQADLRNSRKKETGAQMQADDAEAWEREVGVIMYSGGPSCWRRQVCVPAISAIELANTCGVAPALCSPPDHRSDQHKINTHGEGASSLSSDVAPQLVECCNLQAARKAHRAQQLLSQTEARLDNVAARERHAAHREAHIRDWEQHMAQREAWLHAREREVAAAEARLGRRPGRP